MYGVRGAAEQLTLRSPHLAVWFPSLGVCRYHCYAMLAKETVNSEAQPRSREPIMDDMALELLILHHARVCCVLTAEKKEKRC